MTGLGFKCDHCGCLYMHRRSLDRHVARNHSANLSFNCSLCGKSYARLNNLEVHKRTSVGPAAVAAAPAAKRRRTVVPEFAVRRKRYATWLAGSRYIFPAFDVSIQIRLPSRINVSINVYGVEDGKKVICQLRV